jgi:hypothetical protein
MKLKRAVHANATVLKRQNRRSNEWDIYLKHYIPSYKLV